MSIIINRNSPRKLPGGNYNYYIDGNSGDYEMYGKNMIRATKQSIINVIKKFFPIFKYIPYAYKKLEENLFFDVIKNTIKEKPELAKYLNEGDYPKDYEDFLIQLQMNKYNI